MALGEILKAKKVGREWLEEFEDSSSIE